MACYEYIVNIHPDFMLLISLIALTAIAYILLARKTPLIRVFIPFFITVFVYTHIKLDEFNVNVYNIDMYRLDLSTQIITYSTINTVALTVNGSIVVMFMVVWYGIEIIRVIDYIYHKVKNR